MKTIKQVAAELKQVLDIHTLAFDKKWDYVWKACNEQLEVLGTEACIALGNKEETFWALFPNGNQSILEHLDAPSN